ncbi:MAG: hypothetical protein ACXVVU_25925 [Solirubrobacteraceae bacterium]
MRTADPDLHQTFAPLREVEPTPDEITRVLALADELRSPRSLAAPRRRAGRAVALVAATAAVIGGIAALPGGESPSRPQDAHGILQAAAAVAAEQPAPAAYRYTRALERFVYGVNATDGQHGRITEQQTSENWTSDGWRGRTTAARGTAAWETPPTPALVAAAGDVGAVVKAYDGDYRYGDGPLARVPFAAIPRDAASAAQLLEAAIRDGRWLPGRHAHPHWAPGVVDSEVARSAVLLLAMGNLDGGQRRALFGLLGSRPGARAMGEVTDAAGRKGVGVALPLPDFGDELRVIIDPETSDILQSTEVMAPPPASPPKLPAGVRKPPWPPPAWLAERTQVFLSTGSVAALGERP